MHHLFFFPAALSFKRRAAGHSHFSSFFFAVFVKMNVTRETDEKQKGKLLSWQCGIYIINLTKEDFFEMQKLLKNGNSNKHFLTSSPPTIPVADILVPVEGFQLCLSLNVMMNMSDEHFDHLLISCTEGKGLRNTERESWPQSKKNLQYKSTFSSRLSTCYWTEWAQIMTVKRVISQGLWSWKNCIHCCTAASFWAPVHHVMM